MKAEEIEKECCVITYDVYKDELKYWKLTKCRETPKNYSVQSKDGRMFYCKTGDKYNIGKGYAMVMSLHMKDITTATLQLFENIEANQKEDLKEWQRLASIKIKALNSIDNRRKKVLKLLLHGEPIVA